MPAASLVSMATRVCQKNIDVITDIGRFEFWQISHILMNIRSAKQLRTIEINSPQVCGEATEIWKRIIARDFPTLLASKNYVPKNPKKWYAIYEKYKKEQEEEIKRDEEILRQSMAGATKQRTAKVLKMRSLPPLPKERKFGNDGARRGPIFKIEGPADLRFTSGSKTKLTDGKSVLTRAKREAKEIAQMGKLSRPTHQLHIGTVNRAPAAMVNQYRTANLPAIKTTAGGYRSIPAASPTSSTKPSLEDREARLRNAMRNRTQPSTFTSQISTKQTVVSDDEDDEDNDEGEGEDLFSDDEERPAKRARLSNSPGVEKGRSPPPKMRPMAPRRKKAPVDVFNRGKKPVRRV